MSGHRLLFMGQEAIGYRLRCKTITGYNNIVISVSQLFKYHSKNILNVLNIVVVKKCSKVTSKVPNY